MKLDLPFTKLTAPSYPPLHALDTKKANFSVKMSTAASPKLEDEHVVAATDVKRGTTDQAHFVDVESVVNGETVGAAEDIVASNDDKDVEKGCVTSVDDPPDGLDCDVNLLEEKIEGSHASLEVVGDTERTDNEIDQASAEVSWSSQVAQKSTAIVTWNAKTPQRQHWKPITLGRYPSHFRPLLSA